MPKCAVIVITYNGKQWYDKCLQSILSSSISLDVIVIDNNSTDDTVDYINNNFPEVKVIKNNENVGFAKANNIGLNIAYNNGSKYFFLLNQDAWVEYNTIETLITIAEKHKNDFGIISPIHLTANKDFFDRGFIKYFYEDSYTIHAYENLFLKKLQPVLYESRFVNAAAWLITRKCVETVGGFDTTMFKHYGEDLNYCQRVFFHGLKIGIAPSATICHDRADRIDSPYDPAIDFSVFYGNILFKNQFYLYHIFKILIKSCFRTPTKHLKEILFVVKNAVRIHRSRKMNKTMGRGLEYLEKI